MNIVCLGYRNCSAQTEYKRANQCRDEKQRHTYYSFTKYLSLELQKGAETLGYADALFCVLLSILSAIEFGGRASKTTHIENASYPFVLFECVCI